MRIAVFGIGYVGAVSAGCLAHDGRHDVIAVDVNPQKVALINAGRSPIIEPGLATRIRDGVACGALRATTDAAEAIAASDVLLVCVGTPSQPSGNLDLSHVVRVCEQIGQALRERDGFCAVVVRSTMLPGSMTERVVPTLERASGRQAGVDFGVAVCPEFLREGSAIRDYYDAPVFIAGVLDARTLGMLQELNAGLPTKVLRTEPATAEMLKYASNAWHAVKVVFANEIGALSKAVGVDGRDVMTLLCSDHRLNISAAYMRPGFAFGGSCLPKDLRALLYRAKQLDLDCPLLAAAPLSNDQQIRRAVEMVCATGRRRVGLIGLTFKGGTDDLRESPVVDLAERLLGKGYDLRIFDRNVNMSQLSGANRSFIEARIPHLARLLADEVGEVARHGDTLVLAHQDPAEADALSRLRDDQIVIDLGGFAVPSRQAGARYDGLCW
jgi:GDP-mannose 6-dehydrogenase